MELVRELKRKTLKIKIDGEEYKILFPTVRQLSTFQESFNKKQDLDLMIKFIAELGLPEHVGESLEADHLKDVFEVISGQKKS
jgi:hypothetical protein